MIIEICPMKDITLLGMNKSTIIVLFIIFSTNAIMAQNEEIEIVVKEIYHEYQATSHISCKKNAIKEFFGLIDHIEEEENGFEVFPQVSLKLMDNFRKNLKTYLKSFLDAFARIKPRLTPKLRADTRISKLIELNTHINDIYNSLKLENQIENSQSEIETEKHITRIRANRNSINTIMIDAELINGSSQ